MLVTTILFLSNDFKKTGKVFISLPVYFFNYVYYLLLINYYSASTASPSNVNEIGTVDPFGETLT